MSRILGLDVLRGLAIFLVLIWHWIPESYGINYLFNGKLGVNIFFVLSGYLISKGLYVSKETNLKRQLYRFYFKRFLRIFPIYYLLLIILVSIDYSYIRSVQGWYWFYGVNILIDKTTDFVPYTIHFWSLSVEEQFYIFWPILFIFFAKIKQVHNKFLVAIFLSSILFHLFHSQVQPIYFLNSFLYFFSFAMGAFVYFNISLLKKYFTYSIFTLSLLTIFFVSFLVKANKIDPSLVHFYLDLSYSFFSASLLILTLQNEIQLKKIKFYLKPIVFLGKVSYGVYLYHYLIYPLNHFLHEKSIQYNLNIPMTNSPLFPEFGNPFMRFVYFFILTLIISTISFYLIEKPILSLTAKKLKK